MFLVLTYKTKLKCCTVHKAVLRYYRYRQGVYKSVLQTLGMDFRRQYKESTYKCLVFHVSLIGCFNKKM